jgi:hypothetical protein
MRDPLVSTPVLFNYFWIYWILKQQTLPKDIIYLIIGKSPCSKFYFSVVTGRFYEYSRNFEFCKLNYEIYKKWWENGKWKIKDFK